MDNRSILLVEDNADDEKLALRAFKLQNVENRVIVVHDGQEAVEYLFDPGKDVPAFILLDLKIPKISGLEVLKRVRADARTKLTPVIILTSSAQDSDLRLSYGLGANSYICKPLDLDRFSVDMGLLVRYWLGVNKPSPAGKV